MNSYMSPSFSTQTAERNSTIAKTEYENNFTTPVRGHNEFENDSDNQSTIGSTPFSGEGQKYLKSQEMNFDISTTAFDSNNQRRSSLEASPIVCFENNSESDQLARYITQVELLDENKEQAEMLVTFTNSGGITQSLYRELMTHIFQSLIFVKHLPDTQTQEIENLSIFLPDKLEHQEKTLILDLDETLVHCVGEQRPGIKADVFLPITLPSNRVAGFNIRPYAVECLQEANKHYEVIVFTASHKVYADVILDYLDPTGQLIQHRVYKESCIRSNTDPQVQIKDLRIFKNREIKDLVIVDNCVYAFAFHLDNGIPITNFKDDKNDYELSNLSHYLNQIYKQNDLRVCNRKAFELRDISKINVESFIHYYEMDTETDLDEDDQLEEQLQHIQEVRSRSFNSMRPKIPSEQQNKEDLKQDIQQQYDGIQQPEQMFNPIDEKAKSAEVEFNNPLGKKLKTKKRKSKLSFEGQINRECKKLEKCMFEMQKAKISNHK